MSSIKKLAGETMWYGASSIFAKFLNYMLTPYLTLKFKGTPEYGEMSLVYATISFVNIGVLFGLDYAYFRYIQRKEFQKDLYSTLLLTLMGSTTLITTLILLFRMPIARSIDIANHPSYVVLTVAGFGGMINETFDRIMLDKRLTHVGDYATYQVGIYSGCYKLSLLITLFVQAFRMGAEPFFFRQSVEDSAQRTYARVMKFFVILVSGMFLFVTLYLDIWKYFIADHSMWVGLKVVPILLFANIFLGS